MLHSEISAFLVVDCDSFNSPSLQLTMAGHNISCSTWGSRLCRGNLLAEASQQVAAEKARRRQSSSNNAIAPSLQIPDTINNSKGSLAEFAARVSSCPIGDQGDGAEACAPAT